MSFGASTTGTQVSRRWSSMSLRLGSGLLTCVDDSTGTSSSSQAGPASNSHPDFLDSEGFDDEETVPSSSTDSSQQYCPPSTVSSPDECSPGTLCGANEPDVIVQEGNDADASAAQQSAQEVEYALETPIPGWPGFFVVIDGRLSTHDLDQCFQIQVQLREAFNCHFKPKKSQDTSHMTETAMIRYKERKPKAGVIITCRIDATRKRLQKIVKSQKALYRDPAHRLLTYPVIVCVGDMPIRMTGKKDIVGSSEVYTSVEESFSTLSGVVAHVSVDEKASSKYFTIGGMVLIAGEPHVLTVAHPFQHDSFTPSHKNYMEEDSSDLETFSSSEEEYSDVESIATMFPTEAAESEPPTQVSHKTTPDSLHAADFSQQDAFREPSKASILQLEAPTHISRPSALTTHAQVGTTQDPDLALIPLREHFCWKPNLVSIPGERFPREITKFAEIASPCEVWINCGVSGVQWGRLMEGIVFLDYSSTWYGARKIILKKPLLPGDSGSWVIWKGELCGHIAAAKPNSPEAFMIPIEAIQDEIGSVLHVDDFRMPDTSTAMFAQFSKESFDKHPSPDDWGSDLDPRTRLQPHYLGSKNLRGSGASTMTSFVEESVMNSSQGAGNAGNQSVFNTGPSSSVGDPKPRPHDPEILVNDRGKQTLASIDPPPSPRRAVRLSEHLRHSDPKNRISRGIPDGLIDPRLRVQPSYLFKPGRVFKILWAEPKGTSTRAKSFASNIATVGVNVRDSKSNFWTGFRRFIVVQNKEGHCSCVPIYTYAGQGCSKSGVNSKDHGAIYEVDSTFELLPREPALGFRPVRHRSLDGEDAMSPAARINYSKLCTVEHNVKIAFVGEVLEEDMHIVVGAVKTYFT